MKAFHLIAAKPHKTALGCSLQNIGRKSMLCLIHVGGFDGHVFI
jgi:hypothetical protein